MSRSFLDLLPFETRSQIFRYVLSSPTGYITLSRTLYPQKPIRYKLLTLDESGSGCEVIKLSFLRTCSQIYKECRDLLWKYNTLDLVSYMHETSSPNLHSLREMHTGISYWARAVQMDYDSIARALLATCMRMIGDICYSAMLYWMSPSGPLSSQLLSTSETNLPGIRRA
jgi:hypothetical protein